MFVVGQAKGVSTGIENRTGTCHSGQMPSLINLNERDVDRWTLRLVIERGALLFECQNCWHLSEADVLDLVGRFGPDAVVAGVRQRMVCRRCGKRRVRSPL